MRFRYTVSVFGAISLMSVWLWGCMTTPLTPAPTSAPLPTLALPVLEATTVNAFGAPPRITLESAVWLSDTLTLTMRLSAIPGDYLFTDPVLQIEQMRGDSMNRIAPTAESLTTLRNGLLNWASTSDMATTLVFSPVANTGAGALVFNPNSTANNVVTPRVAIEVQWRSEK